MLTKEELAELISEDVNSFNNEIKNVSGGAVHLKSAFFIRNPLWILARC